MDKPEASSLFPSDVIERARLLLEAIGSVGAYSHSQGVPLIRQHVAEFLKGLFHLHVILSAPFLLYSHLL